MSNPADLPPAPTYDGAVSSSPWTPITDLFHLLANLLATIF